MSLGLTTISWRSCKQSIPTHSTIEAAYVVSAEATKEFVWLRKILDDLEEKQVNATLVLIDNTYAIKLEKNHSFHDQTKHINTVPFDSISCRCQDHSVDTLFHKRSNCRHLHQSAWKRKV